MTKPTGRPTGRPKGSAAKRFRPGYSGAAQVAPPPVMVLEVGQRYRLCRKNLDGTLIDKSKLNAFSTTTTKENELTVDVLAAYPRYYLVEYNGIKVCINKGEIRADYAIDKVI